jgi:hypothetical protein
MAAMTRLSLTLDPMGISQLEFELFHYPLANKVAKGYSNATFRPSFHNILQWILTKLGTYLVLKRIWNPIDFQGHTGFPFDVGHGSIICIYDRK